MDPRPNLTVGQRIRLRRERVGMTRPVLGGLVGRSWQWVRAVESGAILLPRLPMLLRLAEVLGVTNLADLTGDQSLPVASVTRASVVSKAVIQRTSPVASFQM